MSGKPDNQSRPIENSPLMDYKPIMVYSKTTSLDTLEPEVKHRLSYVNGPIAVKGGFARELLRLNLGLTQQCNYDKLIDLDIVVFETPSDKRDERIARRKQIASLSEHYEPKDIEICNSTPEGLVHYFQTRDVTMNELVMFKDGDNLQFLYSQECLEDLKNRVIRPSVHLSHTGLGLVWSEQEGRRLLSAATVGRCIYRKVKNDGDVFMSDEINFYDSVLALNIDDLFKIIKRFTETPQLLENCIHIYEELGVSVEMLSKVRDKIIDPNTKKSRGHITSEVVEDMLDERAADYENWLKNSTTDSKSIAEVIFI